MIASLLAADPTTDPAVLHALVERTQTSTHPHLTTQLLTNRALSPTQRDLLLTSARTHWRLRSLQAIAASDLPRAEVMRLLRGNPWDEYDLFTAIKELPPSAPSTVRTELLRQLAHALKTTGRWVALDSGFLLTQPHAPAALLRRAARAQASTQTPAGKIRLAYALATHPRYRTSTLRAARLRGDLTKKDAQDLLDLSTLPWHTTPHEHRDEHWMQMLAHASFRTSRAELIEATADQDLIRATFKNHPTTEEASAVLSHNHLPHDLLRPAAALARYTPKPDRGARRAQHHTVADLIATSPTFANHYLLTASRAADAQYAWHAPELPAQTIAALAAMLELDRSRTEPSDANAWLAIQTNTPFTVRRRELERAGTERWVSYVQAGAPRMPAALGGAHVPVSTMRATQFQRPQWQAMWRAAGAHLASRSGDLAGSPRALDIAEGLMVTFTGTLGELVTTALAIAGPPEA